MTLHIGEDITIEPFTKQYNPSLAARKLTTHLTEFFTQEINQT